LAVDHPSTEESAPPLQVDSARIAYGGREAVDGVSLRIAGGDVYALVGPNGAGKSSLIKAICARLPLAGGAISVGGAPAGAPEARRRIGIAPQRPALYDRLTARENIACFARLAGLNAAEAKARAADALSLAGLDALGDALAGKLSGGQRQRINIAAAVAHGPSLAILDEPAAALDRDGVEGVNALIEKLAARGVGVLLVTHDMAQADLLASRVGVLDAGRIVAEDAPARLRDAFGGGGLIVTIVAEESAKAPLTAEKFERVGQQRWRGRLQDHGAAAALADRVARAGGAIRSIETAAPTLADAVASILARRAQTRPAA
jgi:ABC-2 type transport system ATP-binding protein